MFLPGGRQHRLGPDERYSRDNPPRKTPKDPPEAIRKAYFELSRKDRPPADRTLGDIFDEYLKATAQHTKGTQKVTRLHLKWFRREIGDKLKVSKLKPHHVTEHLRNHPNWSGQMQRVAIAKVKTALNYGVREGWIDVNPLKGVKKPPSARRTKVITPEEQEKLEAGAVPELRRFLIAMRETGCRPGELASATIADLDLKACTLTVKNKTAATTGITTRVVYLSPRMKAHLVEVIGSRKSGHIFLNCEGNPWTVATLTTRVWKLRNRLGLGSHCCLYSYRHRFTSNSINNSNINPALVARQLGHQDLTMLTSEGTRWMNEGNRLEECAVIDTGRPFTFHVPSSGNGPSGFVFEGMTGENARPWTASQVLAAARYAMFGFRIV